MNKKETKNKKSNHYYLKCLKENIEKGKFKKGEKLLRQYLEEYPDDTYGLFEYVHWLRKNNFYHEALNFIEKIENDKDDSYFTIEKYFIYFQMGLYEEAYKLIDYVELEVQKDNGFTHSSLEINKIFLENKLGIKYDLDLTNECYLINQLYNYSEEQALYHIALHKNEIPSKEKHTVFVNGIDIENLFFQIKYMLAYSKIHSQTFVTDIYYFEYPKIDTENEIDYKCLKVVTIRDTDKIIAMYPIFSDKKYDDINLLDIEGASKNESKVKKISMIDKFNKKYNNY